MDRNEVFLNAGDFYFHRPEVAQRAPLVLRTLLGSCVSIALWHPEKKLGGMCHCVLPTQSPSYGPLDGNHCEGAMHRFLRELQRTATQPPQYRVYLMGGARMSLGLRNADRISVGERNIETCRLLLTQHGFRLHREHVGATGPRRIQFNLACGTINVLHANKPVLLSAAS